MTDVENGGESGGEQSVDVGNLFDIKEGGTKRRRKKKDKEETGEPESGTPPTCKKPTIMEIIMPYVDSLLDLPAKCFDLPIKFATIEMDQLVKLPVRVNDGDVLSEVKAKGVDQAMLHFSKNTLGQKTLDPDHSRKATLLWLGASTAIKDNHIANVRELSDPGYCWHRLPFDLSRDVTPTFDEMFSRIDNALAVKQWIGALLDPLSDRQHYVWLHGPGGQGKGALSRFLRDVFGPSYKAVVPPSEGDKFWTGGLVGKRLVVFNDCKDVNFPVSGLGKSLVGGDAIPAEKKGGDSFTMLPTCMLMYNSNDRPKLTSEPSDTRRVILAYVAPRPEGSQKLETDKYNAILWAEGSGFLWECREEYRRMKESGASYTIDTEELDELTAENEMPLSSFFKDYFKIVPLVDGAIARDQPFITPQQFNTVLRLGGKWSTQQAQQPFLKWVHRAVKINSHPVKVENGTTERRYMGLGLTEKGAALVEQDNGPRF